MVVAFYIPCLAQVVVVRPPAPVFPLPPPIVFAQPPEMIVLPETEVYVVPNVEQDVFFYNGYWWRPWEGRWYRSQYYDRGWGFYQGVPSWYRGIPRGWRDNYRTHMWGGHPWEYRRIPHNEFRSNWRGWQQSGHWRNQRNWGTEGRYHGTGTKGGTTGNLNKGGSTGTKQYNKGGTAGTKQQINKGATGQQHQGTGKAVEKHDR